MEIASLAILLGLIYLGYFMYKRDRLVAFGIFWFFVTLSVESTIIPIRDFMFEHRMYLPSFGLILAAGAGLSHLPQALKLGKSKVPATLAILAALVLAFGIAAYARNNVWQTDLSLWGDSVKKSPEKARPWMWQGIAYSNLKKYNLAKQSFDKSIELMPDFAMGYFNRGNVFKELNEYPKSIADYTKAIEFKKDYAMAYFNRGVVRAKIGQQEAAIEDYDKALKYNPRNSLAYYNRGNAYRVIKKYQKAIADYDRATAINPGYSLAMFNRGLCRAALDQHREAIVDYDKAIAVDSKNYLFFNGKGVSLHALKMYPEAIVSYSNSISLNPKFGQAYFNRAYSKFFGMNDDSGACKDWQDALNLDYKSAASFVAQYCQGGNARQPGISTEPQGQKQAASGQNTGKTKKPGTSKPKGSAKQNAKKK
jgi:tetratricopeptide (TPR) repeat protein